MRAYFRAGEMVPVWLERIEPAESQDAATFGVDVLVEDDPSGGFTVQPLAPLHYADDCVIRVRSDRRPVWSMTGAPTTIRADRFQS